MTTVTSNAFQAQVVSASTAIDFPRIGAMAIGGNVYTPTNSAGLTLQDRIDVFAKIHTIVAGGWRGWSYSGQTLQTIASTILLITTTIQVPPRVVTTQRLKACIGASMTTVSLLLIRKAMVISSMYRFRLLAQGSSGKILQVIQ